MDGRLAFLEQRSGESATLGRQGARCRADIERNDEMILTRKIALGVAGVVAAGVLGTAGVAAATSSDSTPAPSASAAPSSSAAPKAEHRKARRALVGRGMHGVWVVKGKDGNPVTLETIRGTVTAVGSSSVTVKAEDGFTATFATNADTKVRGGGADALGDVKAGAKAAMVGVKSGSTTTARAVLVRK
jgi:hypothetical protein